MNTIYLLKANNAVQKYKSSHLPLIEHLHIYVLIEYTIRFKQSVDYNTMIDSFHY